MTNVLTEACVYIGVVLAVGVTGFYLYRLVRGKVCPKEPESVSI